MCLALGLALARPPAGQPFPATALALTAQAVATSLPDAPVPHALTAPAATGTSGPAGAIRARKAAPASTAACTEPGCPVGFQGGAVQHSPAVYLLLWGPAWTATTGTAPTAYNRLYAFFHGLGQGADSWSTVTSQYGDGGGTPAFGHPVLQPGDVYTDRSTPPSPVTASAIAARVQALASAAGITDLADSQVVVAIAPGACYAAQTAANGATVPVFAGSCGQAAATGSCGWHADAAVGGGTLAYVALPYELDAGPACGENWVNAGTTGAYDGFTTVAGAQYADTITDPDGSGWYDAADTITKGEVGDKCAWGGKGLGYTSPKGNISLPVQVSSTRTQNFPFAVQSLWSNSDAKCVLTSSPAISLATPGTPTSVMGTAASLQVRAWTNTGTPISYSASGLPHGLAIDAATGRIAGTISVRQPGALTVTVRAANYGASRSATFTWRVNSRTGSVRGASSGKCLQGQGNKTVTGTPIVQEPCGPAAAGQLTLQYNGLLHAGTQCVTVNTRVFFYPCRGLSAQAWTWQPASGEYVLAASGRCLTSTTTASGASLAMTTCRAVAPQRWSLP